MTSTCDLWTLFVANVKKKKRSERQTRKTISKSVISCGKSKTNKVRSWKIQGGPGDKFYHNYVYDAQIMLCRPCKVYASEDGFYGYQRQ